MTPQRPALAEVLAALTGCDRLNGDAARVGRVVSDGLSVRMRNVETGDEFTGVVPWAHASPAEAVEALATVGLWPWEIGDERAPRWWCDVCGCEGGIVARPRGRGGQMVDFAPCVCARVASREEFERFGAEYVSDLATPPSHDALVAVASLGRPLLQRITHTLAPVIARAAGCRDARVVWRVMGRESIGSHYDGLGVTTSNRPRDLVMAAVAREERRPTSNVPGLWRATWPVDCPYSGAFGTPDDHHGVHAAWPALRTLTVGDGATPQPTGVHLVGLSRDRITLAVEAI